jgi:subtilisin family serine protease
LNTAIALIIFVAFSDFSTEANASDTDVTKIGSSLLDYINENDTGDEVRLIVHTFIPKKAEIFDSLVSDYNLDEDLKLPSEMSREQREEFKIKKNEQIRDAILKVNEKTISKFDFEFILIDVGDSLPYFVIETNVDNVYEIIQSKDVERVTLDYTLPVLSGGGLPLDELDDPPGSSEPEYLEHFETIGIYDVWDDYTVGTRHVDGSNINIGIFDGGVVDSTNDGLAGVISGRQTGIEVHDHATDVALIVGGADGVADMADIYSAGVIPTGGDFGDATLSGFYAAHNYLLNNNVDLITSSLGYAASCDQIISYNEIAQTLDYIVYLYDIPYTQAVGNISNFTLNCNDVSEMVYKGTVASNAIIVGATSIDGQQLAGYSLSDIESYYWSSPTLAAPGGNTVFHGGDPEDSTNYTLDPFVIPNSPDADEIGLNGTSFATPLVAGVIALMLEYEPTLSDQPMAISAILTVASEGQIQDTLPDNGYDDFIGAGLINAYTAFEILENNTYFTYSLTESTDTASTQVNVYYGDFLRTSHVYTHIQNTMSGTATGSQADIRMAFGAYYENLQYLNHVIVPFYVNTTTTVTLEVEAVDAAGITTQNQLNGAVAWVTIN